MDKILRQAKTKGGLYRIVLVKAGPCHCDIIHYKHNNITGRFCNIPMGRADFEFKKIISDSKVFDNINYITDKE